MPGEQSILDPEIERLSERLGKDPDSLVFAPLADAYRRSGLIEEAIDVLRKGMGKHPNYASAYIVLGRCYQDQKMYELARSEYEKALEVDSHNFLASKLYASVLVPLGKKKEALERYKRLLEIDPANVEIQQAVADLGAQAEGPEPKEIGGKGADSGFMSFGDIGKEIEKETSEAKRAPSGAFGLPESETMELGADDAAEASREREMPGSAAVGPAGRSPFDFGSIHESVSAEPKTSKTDTALPSPSAGSETTPLAAVSGRHDFGTFAPVEKGERRSVEEDIVLPKPTGKPAFEVTPDLKPSEGGRADERLAEIYYEQGFVEKAVSTYERLIKAEPSNRDYSRRLAEIKSGKIPDAGEPRVFPSEILEPLPEAAPGPAGVPGGAAGGFSDAATPEGDQTISLTDLFLDESRAAGTGEPAGPAKKAKQPEEAKPKKPPEQPKGGFDSFQNWLDGLGK